MSRSTNAKVAGSLKVRRLPVTFTSDIRRVITRFFDPAEDADPQRRRTRQQSERRTG